MALPWFFRKLFGDTGNNGKIVDDVIPDTVVKTSAQALNATKQAQARQNISALGIKEQATTSEDAQAILQAFIDFTNENNTA